jgi:hypothetical protein
MQFKRGRIPMRLPHLDNPKLAELIGILLGDGSIGIYNCRADCKTKTYYRVKVTLNSDEIKYAEYIRRMFIELFGLEPKIRFKKTEKVCEVLIFKKELVEFFTNIVDLRLAPKRGRAIIPNRYLGNKLELDILRGLFDTDGCIVLRKGKYRGFYPVLELKMCFSPMQSQVIDIIHRRRFKFGVYKLERDKIKIQINGRTQFEKWVKEIGFHNPKNIEKAKSVLGAIFKV